MTPTTDPTANGSPDFPFGHNAPPAAGPDPFDVSRLRLPADDADLRVQELVTSVPCPTDPAVLFVAYYASGELGCHVARGWPVPARVLDLYTEFRNLANGRPLPHGCGLLGALGFLGLDALDRAEKDAMRERAIPDPIRRAVLALCVIPREQFRVDELSRQIATEGVAAPYPGSGPGRGTWNRPGWRG